MGRGGKVPDTKKCTYGDTFFVFKNQARSGLGGGGRRRTPKRAFVLVLGVVVAAAGRGWGWKVVESSQNPETSICARFGDGSGGGSGQRVGNPKNEQSCLLLGLARWWWQQEP